MTMQSSFDGQVTETLRWHAPGPALLSRIDLSGLVESGLVTSVEMQADGGLVMVCPQGLPGELMGLVEPLMEPLVLTRPEDRMTRLERDLAALTAEVAARDKLGDRMDAVEFGLAEKLQSVIAEEVMNLFEDGPRPEFTSIRDPLPGLVARMEAAIEGLAQPYGLAPLTQSIVALTERVAALERPDLRGMTALHARIEAMGAGLRQEVATLAAETAQAFDALSGRIEAPAGQDAQIEAMGALLSQDINALAGEIGDALGALGQRLAALEALPAGALDEQRRSLAGFGRALGATLQRVEAASEGITAAMNRAEDPLTDAVLILANRLAEKQSPQPDLTAFRNAEAEFFRDLRCLLADEVQARAS